MNTKDIALSAMMAAIVAAMAFFPPITLFLSPVPIALQSLGAMLAGSLLGAKRAGLALLLFLILLVIGFPVYPGLIGGFGLLLTPAGGFLLSWPLVAFVIGWLTEKNWQSLNFFKLFLINISAGILLMYLISVPWMAVFAKLSLTKAFYLALMFLPGDILKALLAAWVGMTFKKHYPLIESKR